jgi:hypothetical protein
MTSRHENTLKEQIKRGNELKKRKIMRSRKPDKRTDKELALSQGTKGNEVQKTKEKKKQNKMK